MPVLFALFLAFSDFTARGYVESRLTVYPQTVAGDSSHAVGEALARYEGAWKPSSASAFRFAGALDLATDTHRQIERRFRLGWDDRELQRPAVSVARFSALYSRGPFTIEAGKQLVRWGKTDIVNPTDRFAPQDFLSVVDGRYLAVHAVRATYERKSNTVDVLWSPRFTPSRIPLWNQRWAPPGSVAAPPPALFPGGDEFGLRWSRTGRVDFSFAAYRGFHHSPAFDLTSPTPAMPFYPRVDMLGGDAAIPLSWLTLKVESAWFHSPDKQSDDYGQFVVQLERQVGEWSFIGGYAGERVTRRGPSVSFDPSRGMTRTILGRASYALGSDQSLAIEAAVRENGKGLWTRVEYTRGFGRHWQWIGSGALIRGEAGDFLGSYRRNAHVVTRIRYNF
jgi:hypothetical protein